MRPSKQGRFLAGIFLLSAALLGFEILAVRLVSILLYPVAAYLVISLALLGFGVSGGFLALRKQETGPPQSQIALAAALFGLAVLLSLLNVWFAAESLYLSLLLILSFSVPFFLGGYAIGSALSLPDIHVTRVYFADLFGAGVGAGVALLGLRYVGGVQAGVLIAILGIASSALLHPRLAFKRFAIGAGLVLILGLVLFSIPSGVVPIAPKELAHFIRIGDQVRWEYQGWDPVARVDVLSLPGDTLNVAGSNEYKLVTQDGGAPTLLVRPGTEREAADFADHTIFGMPHWIKSNPRVLVIGVGGGPDLLAALQYEPERIVGLEVNSHMLEITDQSFSDFIGNLLDDPRVEVVLGDGRHYVQRSDERFDIIQLTGVDTTVAAVGANPNLAENFLYTMEAFEEYFAHLEPDGLLSLSFPNVPGLGLRMLALIDQTLQLSEGSTLADHIVVSEITGFVHVLTKKTPFTPAEVEVLQSHFDRPVSSIYFPLYNRLFGTPDEDFFEVSGILAAPGMEQMNIYAGYFAAVEDGQSEDFLAAQPQTLTLPTDNQPFFFVVDRWGESAPNLQTLVLTLVILSITCVGLMIVPPAVLRRRGLKLSGAPLLAVYFLLLGLGFIFIEVVFIQRVSLFLGHPSYALAVTLSTLLIASGLGSLGSGRWEVGAARKVALATVLVAVSAVGGSLLLRVLTEQMLALPLSARLAATILLIALPGFFMGIPFPTVLGEVKARQFQFVPWAWGINGTASVTATILALLLALSWGFQAVFLIAAALYLLAGAAYQVSER